ncbi:MAG TPA: hypothetical protein VML96_04100, partial [Egibacteraceae bacterium]|nr:hypothetical protein [Egibacteraceae bacterium]
GQGQGQGQGEGQGQGQGQGQGGGGGGGGGNPGGSVTDGGNRGGPSGSAGRGGGEGEEDFQGHDLDLQTVFDPPQQLDADGEDVHLTNQGDPAPGQEVGRAQGAGERNQAIVPYFDVLAEYAAQATRTIESDGYPVRLRQTVRDYFDRLGTARR